MLKAALIVGGNPDFYAFNEYNFSGLKGQTKSSRKGLHYYSNRVTLILASRNTDFVNYLLSSLFKIRNLQLGDLLIEAERVEQELIPDLTAQDKFICLSPLVLTTPTLLNNEATRFIDPLSDEFSDKLYDIVMLKAESSRLFDQAAMAGFNQFQVIPDQEYLAKIAESNKKYSRVYATFDQDVRYDVRGYTFPFYFYCAPELKEMLFIDGLGALPQKGFGMIDLANEDPNNRVQPYEFNTHDLL